jgi:hypothetical protein
MSSYIYEIQDKELSEAKPIAKAAITTYRKQHLQTPLSYPFMGLTFYPISPERRADLQDAVALGATIINFKVGENFQTLTSTDIQTLLTIQSLRVQAAFTHERNLYNAIDDCQSIEDIQSINITEWPNE